MTIQEDLEELSNQFLAISGRLRVISYKAYSKDFTGKKRITVRDISVIKKRATQVNTTLGVPEGTPDII